MSRKTEFTQDDQPEDADIRGWFQALGPPPTGQVSPNLRFRVLAQIEERHGHRRLWAWIPQTWSAPLVPVLTAALVLSLGVNVWWGMSRRAAIQDQDAKAFQAHRFQTGVQNAEAFSTVVTAGSTFGERIVGFGFAPQDARITFFRMGTLYADTLAALHGGVIEVAAHRLSALSKVLADAKRVDSVQVPRSVSQYLMEIQALVESRRYEGKELATFLALFETLYEEEYARGDISGIILFRLGAWLENMSLAAAAGETTSLTQASAVRYFREALSRLHAPRSVLDALEQMQHIMTTETLTERDAQSLRELAQSMQKVLGAMPG